MNTKTDTFIGTTHGNNGHLTIVDWSGTRCNGHKVYLVKCSVCASDPEMFGEGIFKSTKYNINAGSIPCGCNHHPYYTKEQYNVRLSRQALQKDCTILYKEYRTPLIKSKVTLQCNKDGHIWSVTFGSMATSKACPVCAKSGFDPSKPAHFYIIKATKGNHSFTGYGISNVIQNRIATHKKNLKAAGFTLEQCVTYAFSGTEALELEQAVKKSFVRHPQDIEGFKIEATYTQLFSELQAFVEEFYVASQDQLVRKIQYPASSSSLPS